jgi:hypothetical protein
MTKEIVAVLSFFKCNGILAPKIDTILVLSSLLILEGFFSVAFKEKELNKEIEITAIIIFKFVIIIRF